MIFKHSPAFWNKIGTLIKPLTTALNVAIGRTTSTAKLSVQSDGTNDILNLFETGGTEVMTVLESGNVGIGTNAPGTKLDVRDGGSTLLQVNKSYTRSYNNFLVANNGYYGWADRGGVNITAPSSGNLAINNAKVGIGTTSPDTKLQVVGDVKIGDDNTNYTNFDTTGHQTMVGTAKPWDDLRVEPTVRGTGGNNPSFEKYFDDAAGTSRGVYLYSFDNAIAAQEKEVFFTMQMPHSWDGGPIDMHVHWVPFATENATDVVWGLEYTWKDIGEVFGDTVIITSSTTLVPDDANLTAGKHYISEFGMLTPGTTADGLSSILIGRLFRNSSNASDTYTDKVGLLYIDAHFQLSSIGSNDEYVK